MTRDKNEPTNAQRARWAKAALDAYSRAKGEERDESQIRDLISDLLHLAHSKKMDWRDEADIAIRNADGEIKHG